MTNEMSCETDILDYKLFGWLCETTISNLNNDKEVYVRCKDQPWLLNDTVTEFDEAKNKTTIKTRNVNLNSFVYNIKKVSEKIEINSVSPSGVVRRGVEPATVELEVKMLKGADNGKANCYYGFVEG